MDIGSKDALLVTDIQRDFLQGGALEVPSGNEVIAPLNRVIAEFERAAGRIYFSRDWHPADHCSFQAQGGPWPPHCVQGSWGAEFPPELRAPKGVIVISKAKERDKEAYSVFKDTGFSELLRGAEAERLFIGGLVTEYCILNTVTDARALGYEVIVIQDAIRGIARGDASRAREEMRRRGASFSGSADIHGLLPDMARAG